MKKILVICLLLSSSVYGRFKIDIEDKKIYTTNKKVYQKKYAELAYESLKEFKDTDKCSDYELQKMYALFFGKMRIMSTPESLQLLADFKEFIDELKMDLVQLYSLR